MLHSEQKCAHFCSKWSSVDMERVHSGIYELVQFGRSVSRLAHWRRAYGTNLTWLSIAYHIHNSFVAGQYTCINSLRTDNAYIRRWISHIDTDNGQIWNNGDFLSIGPIGINFSETVLEMQLSLKKMHSKISSAKRLPFCLGLNSLMSFYQWITGFI